MASPMFLSILLFLIQCSTALEVSPDSPCVALCADPSEPTSWKITSDDVTCSDADYSSTPTGQKFESCVSCLQSSTYSQGSDNDQLHFLYNIRYTFDSCIFGFPKAMHTGSSPCATSFACGQLETALTEGIGNANSGYEYCGINGDAILTDLFNKCVSCVAATEDQMFLANYLVALQAGCNQEPPAGTIVGLNDTVFSATMIGAVDPQDQHNADGSDSVISTGQIVGIVAGVLVLGLALAGFFFVRHRKRRNRVHLAADRTSSSPGPGSRRPHFHRQASSLSFRCQTHLSPRSPVFFPNPSASTIDEEKPWQASPAAAADSMRPFTAARPYAIDTSAAAAAPAYPGSVHHSPKNAHFGAHDAAAHHRPYHPAEYAPASPTTASMSAFTFGSPVPDYAASPVSGSTASPLLGRAWEAADGGLRRPGLLERAGVKAGGEVRGARRVSGNTGSPVESMVINTRFPGPPTRR
ncbi:hypothetical protein F4780DRAFT_603265 [Xylariomycetidae sp. FL0641]|nr:hypothetical protein F4780DRAFT_603265 [Xylariomycetidae sp. FL0641]